MGGLANSCPGLISTLTSHVDEVAEFLARMSNKDRATAGSLRATLITSLAALTEILELMSRISLEPLATDYRRESIAVLMRAVEVVKGLGHEDITVVGTFLGVRCLQLGHRLSSNSSKLTLAV